MRTVLPLALVLTTLVPMTLSGCSKPHTLSVDGAWVRLSAVADRPAAAYFSVHGGAAPATLINVTADAAVRSEMHETETGPAGATTMAPTPSVAIPAAATLDFAPGGRHVMLFGINPATKPGGTVTLTLTFADGTRLAEKAGVVGAADPSPK